jgi:hypothetical protein
MSTSNYTCNCLALFGSPFAPSQLSQLFDFVIDELANRNLRPDYIGASWEEGTLKNKTLSEATGLLRSRRFLGLESLSISITHPGYTQLAFGYDFSADIQSSCGDVVFSANVQHSANGILTADFLAQVSSILNPGYGFRFARGINRGPSLYAFGVSAGLSVSAQDEIERIGQWMRERISERRFLKGFLRDIYPDNILTRDHLSFSIDGVPLQVWIQGNSHRGALVEIDQKRFLWRIKNDEIARIRDELRPTGMLICS